MKRNSDKPEEIPERENFRYVIALPMEIEIDLGFMKGKKRVPARPVDLAIGGAACHVRPDDAYKVGKRFRVYIDSTACFAEIRNIEYMDDGLTRIGMSFIKLELETQERIVDAIDQAKYDSSRLNPDS